MPRDSNQLTWADLEDLAGELFGIWSGRPELKWARTCWDHLTAAGFTTWSAQTDRVIVIVRLFVVAGLYRDWCSLVWDELHDDSPAVWLSDAPDVDRIYVGQLVPDLTLSDDPDEALAEALFELMRRERRKVIAAILRGFGGSPQLFLALWRSNRDSNALGDMPLDPGGDDDEYETDDEILNEPSGQKLAGYSWIEEGCPDLGPIRQSANYED